MTRYFVGLANTFHDPAVAIVGPDGGVRFAEATERHLQSKRAWECQPDQLGRIAELISEYCEPDAEFIVATTWSDRIYSMLLTLFLAGRLRTSLLQRADREEYSPFLLEQYYVDWLASMMFVGQTKAGANLVMMLRRRFRNNRVKLRHYKHHLTHAAYAAYSSPFREGVCAILDGFGEFGSLSYYRFSGGRIEPLKLCRGTASLGYYYWALTTMCGFDWMKGEEWKVMGLAAFGKRDEAAYRPLRSLLQVDGLELRSVSKRHVEEIWRALEPMTCKPSESPWKAADLACTGQIVFAELMEQLLRNLHRLGGSDNLILGGGCALNSMFNGTIVEQTPFKAVHVPSAPGDDGNAVGAALLAYHEDQPRATRRPELLSPYLGSTLSARSLENLCRFGRVEKMRHLPGTIHIETAKLLASGKLVGWAQGRAEFGPRALGNRSILADPRPPAMKDTINERVKFREEFRPFAPAILHEAGPEYFECYQETPYMERTLRFRPEVRDKIPAVVHADGTGRLQTIKREWNPRFHDLVAAFRDLTGIPLLLNTSFNVMGKPIIHSVEDALAVFYTSGLDVLVLEDYLIEK